MKLRKRILAGLMSGILLAGAAPDNLLPVSVPMGHVHAAETDSGEGLDRITATNANHMEALLSGAYMETYGITVREDSYTCEGGNDERLWYSFNGFWDDGWTAASNGGSITVIFDQPEEVSRILYGVQARRVSPNGYPEILRVEASQTVDEEDFVPVAEGRTTATVDKVMFQLEKPVTARRLKLVFAQTYDQTLAHAAELRFLREDKTFEAVESLFQNYDSPEDRVLNLQYSTDEALDRLEEEAKNHMAKNYLLPKIDRAKKIVTGEIALDEPLTFPEIEVVQKTGPDSEKIVLLYAPDRYVFGNMDSYVQKITGEIQRMFREQEPYRSLADEFNVYVLRVPSNEEYKTGNYGSSYSVDGYFKSMTVSAGDVDVLAEGREKAIALGDQLEEHYLDPDSEVEAISLSINTSMHGGETVLGPCSVAWHTNSNSYGVMVHELGHAAAKLVDEYTNGAIKGCNVTDEADPFAAPWKEMLGFRGVIHQSVGRNNLYRPDYYGCMMEISSGELCEVCKMSAFTQFNIRLANQRDWYVAKPIAEVDYYDLEEQNPIIKNGIEITPDNIALLANGKPIQYRTIVRNLTNTTKTLELEVQIVGADGTVKEEQSKQFEIEGTQFSKVLAEFEQEDNRVDSKKSLQIVLPARDDLVEGDRITGRLTDLQTNEVIMDGDTYLQTADSKKLTIKYRVGDQTAQTQEPLPNVAERSLELEHGTDYQPVPVELNGYTYTGYQKTGGAFVPKGEEIEPITMDQHEEITYYYSKNKGKVTLKLTDLDGQVATKVRYIEAGKCFVPSQNDFPAEEGYHLVLPAVSEPFDGVDEGQILEYRYEEGEAEEAAYSVTVQTDGHGNVEADRNTAKAGEKVVLTVAPEEGYVLKNLKVSTAEGAEISLTTQGSSWSFQMPAGDVSVQAEFEAVEAPEPDPEPEPEPEPDPEPEPVSYNITIQEPEHGSISTDQPKAEEQAEVVLTVSAEEGYVLKSLTVSTTDGTKLEVIQKDEGSWSFRMPAGDVSVQAEFEAVEEPEPEPDPDPDPEPEPDPKPDPDPKPEPAPKKWIFTDVKEQPGDWKYDNIRVVYDRELMGAVGGSTLFQPDRPLSRAMFATVLYRMAGNPETVYRPVFTDVPAGEWYSSAIIWANSQGIVSGYSDGSYGKDDDITREQIAKMLYLYGEETGVNVSGRASLAAFTDSEKVSVWAVEYIQWAVDAGMISGKPNDEAGSSYRLDPGGKATRAECAKMLRMFLESIE